MKVLVQIAVALVLVVVGGICLVMERVERRLADVHEQVATLQYNASAAESDLERVLEVAARVSSTGEQMLKEVRVHRAVSHYWQGDYAALAPKRDTGGALIEHDPEMLLLGANAAYRENQRKSADWQTMVRGLERIMNSYADVIRNGGTGEDTAYNYEFVVRLRNLVAKMHRTDLGLPANARGDSHGEAEAQTDLPEGPTIHGEPGAPPVGTNMDKFKMVVPQRQDERDDAQEAGSGKVKIRKG